MLEAVVRSSFISHEFNGACQNLSLDRLQLASVATLHLSNRRLIAFTYLLWPQCMVDIVARSPLVNYGGHDSC